VNRRSFVKACAAAAALSGDLAQSQTSKLTPPSDRVAISDEGWNLWIDKEARWQDDAIFLPEDVRIDQLPANPPAEGWPSIYARTGGPDFAQVTLPATVEQQFWGKYGSRSYTPEEYRYAADDPAPQNGAYVGVSWWWRTIEIPKTMQGRRIMLGIRGARMRAEVFLNERLVGYSILEELPFECDLTAAAHPGGVNRLAIRITNPGGRYDWVDGSILRWGNVEFHRSHGFGGLDRELTLHASPMDARIADAWVLNTPEITTVSAFTTIEGKLASSPLFEIIDPRSGKVLAHGAGEQDAPNTASETTHWRARLSCPEARVWDLNSPVLYHLRVSMHAGSEIDERLVPFGFRWFAPAGLGENAIFRLNDRRLKIYTSISWGFWGHNGLWPTPELAAREVTQAQKLGLNCLNFHRNVGKEDVLRAHDRLGLLRYMEPGGGKLAIGKLPAGVATNAADIVMQAPQTEADRFSQRYMLAKCRAMVRAFRSHPSLIQYTLQNEIGANLANPETFKPIEIMHEEDPSRCVVLNDGFSPPPRLAPQAWYEPWNDTMHRSDREPWARWWNNHQGAGDQWYDDFYRDAEHFTYLQPLKDSLVEFGEMEGCAVADNHQLMAKQIVTRQFGGNGVSYDLSDHRDVMDAYSRFLDRWGFRKAFSSPDHLYRAIGAKCYESWQQYLENIRICDEVDFAAISGWESTAIENHSGIVDNLRNFKGDPELIASSLRPVRLVAKQHRLCYAMGDQAVFDLYLLNDTGHPPAGTLHFSMIDPAGKESSLSSWNAPALEKDRFSYLVQLAFETPSLDHEGIYRFRFTSEGDSQAPFEREIWVANTKPTFTRPLTIGVSGVLASVRHHLESLPGLQVVDFQPGRSTDLIVASGIVAGSRFDRQVGDETGLEAPPTQGVSKVPDTPGQLADDVLAAARAGTPLLAIVPDDALADGVARQLAQLGLFTYAGQVGDTRAPWMGNWLFVREHPTFAHLPSNCALGIHYQAHGKSSNGLLIERAVRADDPEVIMAYSRDHDRKIGAASLFCHHEQIHVLLHRAPAFSDSLQRRWVFNAVEFMTRARA
jgi:hypothetical protein